MPSFRTDIAVFAVAALLPVASAGACNEPVLATKVAPDLTRPIEHALDAVQRIPGASPAVSAVVVQGDAVPWIHVRGNARADTPATADADTYFYIASQTKSFMGLLAAVLDRKRVLPLDTTLAQVWPALVLPAPADPHRITMSGLLSHQEGLATDTLNFMTAYVQSVPATDYPKWLASETTVRKPGFRYANLGDLVYGAALEARTGRDWHDWLDAEVLRPLRLAPGVSSTSSRVPTSRMAWNHQWDGRQWRSVVPKPDTLMHAAGGLFATANGMARWMQANLGVAHAGGGLQPADFARAQQPIAEAHLADKEIDCNGYSLGWYTCIYKGQHALMHPGSYVGTVSMTVLVPAAQVGLSMVVNSDSAMEGFQLEVMKAFIGLATGQPGEAARLDAAVAAFPARREGTTRKRLQAIATERNDAAWGGWTWRPDAGELRDCSGAFHDVLFGTMQVHPGANGLVADLGALHLTLEPAQPGVFAASDGTMDPPGHMACKPQAGTIEWRDRIFRRDARN